MPPITMSLHEEQIIAPSLFRIPILMPLFLMNLLLVSHCRHLSFQSFASFSFLFLAFVHSLRLPFPYCDLFPTAPFPGYTDVAFDVAVMMRKRSQS